MFTKINTTFPNIKLPRTRFNITVVRFDVVQYFKLIIKKLIIIIKLI